MTSRVWYEEGIGNRPWQMELRHAGTVTAGGAYRTQKEAKARARVLMQRLDAGPEIDPADVALAYLLRPTIPLTPGQRLQCAVLMQAVIDLRSGVKTLQAETREYLFGQPLSGVLPGFGFLDVAESLDLNTEAARRALACPPDPLPPPVPPDPLSPLIPCPL